MPVYNYDGQDVTDVFDYDGVKAGVVYDYERNEIILERPVPTDISQLFIGKKWALIGDSNFDLSFTQHSAEHAQKIVGDAFNSKWGTEEQYYFASDPKSGLAKGGHGFTAPIGSCYMDYVPELRDDLDLVVFELSPNDWKFKDTIKVTTNQPFSYVSGNQYALLSISTPSDDRDTTSAAGYITKTLLDAHSRCPNARVVVLGPFIYPIGSLAGYYNKYYDTMTALCAIVIDDLISQGADWLSPMYECWDKVSYTKSGRTYSDIKPRSAATRSFLTFDECLSGFDGLPFHMNNINPEFGSEDYRAYYTSTIDNKHLGINCHKEFVAPWLAHIVADEFQKIEGTTFTQKEINDALPSDLRWNNYQEIITPNICPNGDFHDSSLWQPYGSGIMNISNKKCTIRSDLEKTTGYFGILMPLTSLRPVADRRYLVRAKINKLTPKIYTYTRFGADNYTWNLQEFTTSGTLYATIDAVSETNELRFWVYSNSSETRGRVEFVVDEVCVYDITGLTEEQIEKVKLQPYNEP